MPKIIDVNANVKFFRSGRAALAYAFRFGWPVFPCQPRGKKPLTPNGFLDATTDPEQIREWWARWPDANIGLATGEVSGFDALDVDDGGDETLAELVAEHGELPDTVEQLTGGGGRHILFKHRDGVRNSTKRLPGIDVRGGGGYIVVAPSVHPNGREYAWELSSRPGEVDLADWPEWLLDALQASNGRPAGPAPAVEGTIPEGQRNATLTSLGGSMRRRGFTPEAILAALRIENQRCNPPLPDAEVERIAASVARYEPTYTPSVGFVGTQQVGDNNFADAWPEPQSLPDALPSVEPFEPTLLPEAFRPWVEDIAGRMQCPIDYPAVGAMVCLATVVGRQMTIQPRRRDDWSVVPNLWGAVVGRPGLLKTPALAEVRRPLDSLEARAREAFESAMRDHQANGMVGDEIKKKAQKEIAAALKKGGDGLAIAKAAITEEAPPPARQRYVVHDATVEKLGEILQANPRGVLLFRDELVGFLKSLDRDGHEADRAFFLEAWNGTGSFKYDRIGRGTLDLETTCVSILGGIQPGPWSVYLSRAARGGGDDDGLVQRFQMVVWPDLPGEWRDVDEFPDSQARQRAVAVFERLDHIDPVMVGAEILPEGGLPFLRFTPAAQELFIEWRGELERRLRGDDLPPLLEGHLAKYRSLIPTLALLIHLADAGHGLVGEGALVRACAWGDYLESHAQRLYAPALSPAAASTHALARRILKGDLGKEFALRNVQQMRWSGLREAEEIKGGLESLESLGWIRYEKIKTDGRPRERYFVNPHLFGKVNADVSLAR